jgi:hypothetical protein
MKRITVLFIVAICALSSRGVGAVELQSPPARKTTVAIAGDAFHINGKPTYEGRTWNGKKIEGLLLNSRMVQGIFDDLNDKTRSKWAYPDTGKWDADRNTREFVAAMPEWRKNGLLAFTISLQGGSPQGYSQLQPWHNSAITAEGELRPDYMARLEKILDRADELGMVSILTIFYFGQDERLKDEAAVRRAVERTVDWVHDRGYTNVLIEIANECDNGKYERDIIKAPRIHELIELAQQHSDKRVAQLSKASNGAAQKHRLYVSASYNGGSIPRENLVRVADFLLMHGNGVSQPARIAGMVRQVKMVKGYQTKPILINEDDHFDFDKPINNMTSAIGEYCSWGYFDPGQSNYRDGYQCPPVNWGLNTERKQAFFQLVKEISGE